MTVAPVLRAAASGVARRPVPTAVLFVVLLAASAAATLGLALYTSANVGFQENFAKYRGAQLAVFADARRVTAQDLENTTRIPEVTGAAGPYPATTVTASTTPSAPGSPRTGPRVGHGPGSSQPLSIVGRARPSSSRARRPSPARRWP